MEIPLHTVKIQCTDESTDPAQNKLSHMDIHCLLVPIFYSTKLIYNESEKKIQ